MVTRIAQTAVVVVALLLAACGTEVKVTAMLNSTQDIKSGDPVFLQEQIVGEVTDISSKDGRIEVTIELDDNGVNSVKQDAALVMNRLKSASPLEIYNRQGAAQPIQDGDQLQGLDSMFQLGAWMVGDSISVGVGGLNNYVDAFQRYLNSEEWQRETQQLGDQAKQAVTATEDVVRQLTDEAAKATEQLYIAEQEAAKAVEQLGEQLKPVVDQVASSSDEVVKELERLVGVLNEQVDEHQPLGTQFAESLLNMMETLGATFEQPQSADSDAALQQKLEELEKAINEEEQKEAAEPEQVQPDSRTDGR